METGPLASANSDRPALAEIKHPSKVIVMGAVNGDIMYENVLEYPQSMGATEVMEEDSLEGDFNRIEGVLQKVVGGSKLGEISEMEDRMLYRLLKMLKKNWYGKRMMGKNT